MRNFNSATLCFIFAILCFDLITQVSFSAGKLDPIPAEPIVKKYDVTGLVVPIKVVVHSSEEDLNKAFKTFYGVDEGREVWGWYAYVAGVCEIHVTELRDVRKDPRMHTWGHELAHCVYGSYHK